MAAWEYKTHLVNSSARQHGQGGSTIVVSMSEAELTKLGAQGWELVAVVGLSTYSFGPLGGVESTGGLEYIFKRPRR